jgi:two-component system cell cycle sensor histidine kinase PleC
VHEYAGLIHDGGQNLLRLINQILDLTKLSAGRYQLHRGRLDASAVLWTVYSGFAARIAAKNLAVDIDAPAERIVDADEAALSCMLTHLVDNAVCFTPDGGRIRLCVAKQETGIAVTIADNGPGVAEEDIARILLPFEQGGRGTADHTSGGGLGLTLTKAFAEAHGGSLTIESGAGKGFTASVLLPEA